MGYSEDDEKETDTPEPAETDTETSVPETQEDNEYICEQNEEWCETHCIDTLRKECVCHYLTNIYKKGQL